MPQSGTQVSVDGTSVPPNGESPPDSPHGQAARGARGLDSPHGPRVDSRGAWSLPTSRTERTPARYLNAVIVPRKTGVERGDPDGSE